MFGNAALATFHRNHVTTDIKDIRLVRCILGENV